MSDKMLVCTAIALLITGLATGCGQATPATPPSGGERIAFASDRDGTLDIYVLDSDGSSLTRLTNTPQHDSGPAWSPDGTRIAFMSEQNGNHDIYVMDADGANVTRLTTDPANDFGAVWSPDGRQIAFVSSRDSDNYSEQGGGLDSM